MNCIIIILFCKTESTHKHTMHMNTAGNLHMVLRGDINTNLKRYYVVAYETIDLLFIHYNIYKYNKQYVYLKKYIYNKLYILY